MALTPAERMSRMRSRQRKAGLMPLSLVVPVGDAAAFTRLAARRRRLAAHGTPHRRPRRCPDVDPAGRHHVHQSR